MCYSSALETYDIRLLTGTPSHQRQCDIWAIALALKSAKLGDTLQALPPSVSLDKFLNLFVSPYCKILNSDAKLPCKVIENTCDNVATVSTLMAITTWGFND